jgi:hypothetical protein
MAGSDPGDEIQNPEYAAITRDLQEVYADVGELGLLLAQCDTGLVSYAQHTLRVPIEPSTLALSGAVEAAALSEAETAVRPKEDKVRARTSASDEQAINAQVIADVAADFGDLTQESAARLDLGEEVSDTRLSIRRQRIEKVTFEQTQKLFEVMHDVATQAEELRDVPIATVLANSYNVGIGYALLPNAPKNPQGLNEVTALQAIQDNPGAWVQPDPAHKRLVFTPEARKQLQAAYAEGSGCPAIGLRVTDSDGESTSDLFVMYWGMLASHYGDNQAAE